MKRLMMLMLVALAIPATAFAATSGGSASTTCTPTGFNRDGINLTAAQIGGKVTGDLDAAGCDIGVYYGPGTKGSVKNATIENARYFGVVNYGGKVNVANSTISQIGNAPFDGTQHGVGIFFTTEATPGVAADVIAKGTIKSPGGVVTFEHRQVWTPATNCATRFQGTVRCIEQHETWSDDNGHPFSVRIDRTQKIGKGVGMGLAIHSTVGDGKPIDWRADLRNRWTW